MSAVLPAPPRAKKPSTPTRLSRHASSRITISLLRPNSALLVTGMRSISTRKGGIAIATPPAGATGAAACNTFFGRTGGFLNLG